MDFSGSVNLEDFEEVAAIKSPTAQKTKIRYYSRKHSNEFILNSPIDGFKYSNCTGLNISCVKHHSRLQTSYNKTRNKPLISQLESRRASNSVLKVRNEASPLIRAHFLLLPNGSSTKKDEIRVKIADFRRMKFSPIRVRANTSMICKGYADNELKAIRIKKKCGAFKRELIPQTKASCKIKSRQTIEDLRISGVMKDFTFRESALRGKDHSEFAEFQFIEIK